MPISSPGCRTPGGTANTAGPGARARPAAAAPAASPTAWCARSSAPGRRATRGPTPRRAPDAARDEVGAAVEPALVAAPTQTCRASASRPRRAGCSSRRGSPSGSRHGLVARGGRRAREPELRPAHHGGPAGEPREVADGVKATCGRRRTPDGEVAAAALRVELVPGQRREVAQAAGRRRPGRSARRTATARSRRSRSAGGAGRGLAGVVGGASARRPWRDRLPARRRSAAAVHERSSSRRSPRSVVVRSSREVSRPARRWRCRPTARERTRPPARRRVAPAALEASAPRRRRRRRRRRAAAAPGSRDDLRGTSGDHRLVQGCRSGSAGACRLVQVRVGDGCAAAARAGPARRRRWRARLMRACSARSRSRRIGATGRRRRGRPGRWPRSRRGPCASSAPPRRSPWTWRPRRRARPGPRRPGRPSTVLTSRRSRVLPTTAAFAWPFAVSSPTGPLDRVNRSSPGDVAGAASMPGRGPRDLRDGSMRSWAPGRAYRAFARSTSPARRRRRSAGLAPLELDRSGGRWRPPAARPGAAPPPPFPSSSSRPPVLPLPPFPPFSLAEAAGPVEDLHLSGPGPSRRR